MSSTQKFIYRPVNLPHLKNRNRICQSCREPYYRRNQVQCWTGRNPGHRAGWYKTTANICLNCQPAEVSMRMLTYVDVKFTKTRTLERIKG